jgi:hypothetical protein
MPQQKEYDHLLMKAAPKSTSLQQQSRADNTAL